MRKLLLLLLATTLAFCSKPDADTNEPTTQQNFFKHNTGDWVGSITNNPGGTHGIAMDVGEDGVEWFVDVYLQDGSCYVYITSIYDNYNAGTIQVNTNNRLVIAKDGNRFEYTKSGSNITINETYSSGLITSGSVSKRIFNECN